MKTLIELSNLDCKQINGGDSGWYYLSYAAGYVMGRFEGFGSFDLSSAGTHWTGA